MTENSNCHKSTNSVRNVDGNNSSLKLDLETLKVKCLEMKLSVVIERLEEQNRATASLERRNRAKKHFGKRFGCRRKGGLKDEDKPSEIGTLKSKSKYDKSHWKHVKKSEKLVNTANVDNGLKDSDNNITKDASSNDHGKFECNLMIVDVRGNALNEFERFDKEMPSLSDGETTEEDTTLNDAELSIPFPKTQLEEKNSPNFAYPEMKQEDAKVHAEKLSDREMCYVIKKEKDDYEDDYRTPSDTDMDYFSEFQKGFDEDMPKLFLTKEEDILNFISSTKCDKDSFVFESCGSNTDDKDTDSCDDIFLANNSRTSPLQSATRKSLKANSSLIRHSEERRNRYLSKKVICKKSGLNEIPKRPSIRKETSKRKLSSKDDPKTKVASYKKRSHCKESTSRKNAASSKKTLGRQRNVLKGSRSLKGQKKIKLAKPQNVESEETMSNNSCLRKSIKGKKFNLLKIKQESIEDEIVSNSPKQNFGQFLKERFEKIKGHLEDFRESIPELSDMHSQLEENSSKERALEKPTITDKLSEERSILYETNCHTSKRELSVERKKKKRVKRKPSTSDCDTETKFSRLKRDLPHFNWLEAKILQAHAASLDHESEMDCGKSGKNPKGDGKTRKSSEDRSETKKGEKNEVKFKRRESMEGKEKVSKKQSGKNCENGEKMENVEKKGKMEKRWKDDGNIDEEKEERKEEKQKLEKGEKKGKEESGKTYKEKRCRDFGKEQKEKSRKKIEEALKGKREKKMEDTQKQKGREIMRATLKGKRDGKIKKIKKEKSIEKSKETQKKKLDGKMEENENEKGREKNKTTEKEKVDGKIKEMKKEKSKENAKESQKGEQEGKTEKFQKEKSGEKIKDNEKEKHEEKVEVQRKKMRGEFRDNQKEKQNSKTEEMQKEKRGEESKSDLKHSGEAVRSIISALEKTVSTHEKEGLGNQILKVCETVKKTGANESKYDMLIQETNQWITTDCLKVPSTEFKDVTENKIPMKDETIDTVKNAPSSEIVEESSKLCKTTYALRKYDATSSFREEMKFVQTSQISSNALQVIASNPPSQEKVNQSINVQPDNLSLKLVPLQQHPNSLLFITEIPVPSTPPLLLQRINVAPQNVVKNRQVQNIIFQPNHPTDAIAYHQQLAKHQLWLRVVPEKLTPVPQQTLYITSREVIRPSRPLKSLPIPLQRKSSCIKTLANSDTNRNSIPSTLPLSEFKSYYTANNNSCHRSRSWPDPSYEKQQFPPTYVLQGPLMRTGVQNPQSKQQNTRVKKSVRAFHKSRDLNNFLFFRTIKYPREAEWCSESENDTLPQRDIKSFQKKSRRRHPLHPEESILIALTCSQPFYCDSSCQQETFSRYGVISRSGSFSFVKQKLQQIKDSVRCVGFTAESEISNCDQRQRALSAFGASVGNDILKRRYSGDLNSLDPGYNLGWKKRWTNLNDEETTDLLVPVSEYNIRPPEEKCGPVVLQNYDLMKENVKENLVQQLDGQKSDKAQSDDVTNDPKTNLSDNRQLKLNDNQQKKLDNTVVNDELKQPVNGDGEILQFSDLKGEKVGFEVCRETFNSTASNEVTSEEVEKSARNNDSQRGVEDVIQSHFSVPLESNQKVENFIPYLVKEGAKRENKELRGTDEEQNAESSNSAQQQKLKLKDNDMQSESFKCTANDSDALVESVTDRDEFCKTRFTEEVEETSVYEIAEEETRTKENLQNESQKQIEAIRNDFHLEYVNLEAVNGNQSVDDPDALQALAVISNICCQIEKGSSMVSEKPPHETNEESNSALAIDIDCELANENKTRQLSESCSVSNEINTASYEDVWSAEKTNINVDIELNSQDENNLLDNNKNIQSKSFSPFNEESGENQMSQLEQTSQGGLIELDVEKKSLVENDPKSCKTKMNAYPDSEHIRLICDVSLDIPELEIRHESQESLNCQKSLKEILSDTTSVDNNELEVGTLNVVQNSAVEGTEEKNANQIQESRKEKDKESSNEMELSIREDATRGIQESDRLKCHINEQRSEHSPGADFESLPLVLGEAKSSQQLMPQKLNESKEVSCVDLQRSVEQATQEDEVRVIGSLHENKKLVETTSDANHANSDLKRCKEAIKNAQTEIVIFPEEVNSNLEKDLFILDGDCFIENEIKRNLLPEDIIQNISEIKENDEPLRAGFMVEIVANETTEPYVENKIESYKNNQDESADRSLTTLKPSSKIEHNQFSPRTQSRLCSTMNSTKVQNATNTPSTSSLKSHQNEILSMAKPLVTESETSEINIIAVEVVTEDQLYNTLSKNQSQEWRVTKHSQDKTRETTSVTSHHDAVVKKTEEFVRRTSSASFGCFSESNRTQPQKKYKVSDGTAQKIAYVKPSTARESSCQSSYVQLGETRRIRNSEGGISAKEHVYGQSQHSTTTSTGEQQMASVSPNSVTKRKPNGSDWLYRNRDLDYEIIYENIQNDSVLLPRFSNEVNRRREELRILNLLAKRKETEFQMLQNLRKSKMKLLHTLKEYYWVTRNLYQDEIRNYISLDDEIDNLIQEENPDKISKLDEALQEIYEASSPVSAVSGVQSISKPLKRISPSIAENIPGESRIDIISSLTRNFQQLKAPEDLKDTRKIKGAATFGETVSCTKNSAIRNDPGFEESRRIDGSPAKLSPEILQETQKNSAQNLTTISSFPSLEQNINCFKKQTQSNLDDNQQSNHSTSWLMSFLIEGESNAKEKMRKNVTDSCSTQESSLESHSQENLTCPYQSQGIVSSTSLENRENTQRSIQKGEFGRTLPNVNTLVIEFLKQNAGYPRNNRLNSTENSGETTRPSFVSKFQSLESSNSRAAQEWMEHSSHVSDSDGVKKVKSRNTANDLVAHSNLKEMLQTTTNPSANNPLYNKTPTEHLQSAIMAHCIPELPVQLRKPHPNVTPHINPEQDTAVSLSSIPGRTEQQGSLCSGKPLRMKSAQTLKPLEHLQLICSPQNDNVIQFITPVSNAIKNNEAKAAPASISAPLPSLVSFSGVSVAKTVTTNSEFIACQKRTMPFQNNISQPWKNENFARINPAALRWQLPFYNSIAGCSKSDLTSNRNSPQIHNSVRAAADNTSSSVLPSSNAQHHAFQQIQKQQVTKEIPASPTIKPNKEAASTYHNILLSTGLRCDQTVSSARFQNVQSGHSPLLPKPCYEILETSASLNDNSNRAHQNMAQKNQQISHFPSPGVQLTLEDKQRQCSSDPGREFDHKDKSSSISNRGGQVACEGKEASSRPDSGTNLSHKNQQLPFYPNPEGQLVSRDKGLLYLSNSGPFAPESNAHEERQLQSFATRGRQLVHEGRQIQDLPNEGGQFVHGNKQIQSFPNNPGRQFVYEGKQFHCLLNPGVQYTQEGKQVHCLSNSGGQIVQDPKLSNIQRLHFTNNGKQLACFYNPGVGINSSARYNSHLQKYPGEFPAANHCPFGSTKTLFFDPSEQKTVRYQPIQHQRTGQYYPDFRHQYQSPEAQENGKAIHYCCFCLKEAFFVCSNCKNEWYCSKKCQENRWMRHSLMCKQFKPT